MRLTNEGWREKVQETVGVLFFGGGVQGILEDGRELEVA